MRYETKREVIISSAFSMDYARELGPIAAELPPLHIIVVTIGEDATIWQFGGKLGDFSPGGQRRQAGQLASKAFYPYPTMQSNDPSRRPAVTPTQ